MRAPIAYYDPPRRPAPGIRPDFTRLPLTAVPVTIGDLRDGAGDCSLDREGFAVAAAPTSVRDFYDSDEVARVYPAEAAELLRALTDQSCPADAPPRASIEIRMFAFYEEPAR